MDGRPVGIQDVIAANFPVLRGVDTYSWLGIDHQGQGFGREMRAAVLHLAFDGLGAVRNFFDVNSGSEIFRHNFSFSAGGFRPPG